MKFGFLFSSLTSYVSRLTSHVSTINPLASSSAFSHRKNDAPHLPQHPHGNDNCLRVLHRDLNLPACRNTPRRAYGRRAATQTKRELEIDFVSGFTADSESSAWGGEAVEECYCGCHFLIRGGAGRARGWYGKFEKEQELSRSRSRSRSGSMSTSTLMKQSTGMLARLHVSD